MPKIFEYLGLVIFFYSNEHEPVHVHATKGECESKAEFEIIDGTISSITIKAVKSRIPLSGSDLENFKIFLNAFGDDIVEKWIDYFVYHKKVTCQKITKRIK
jgi:hypothetical protein